MKETNNTVGSAYNLLEIILDDAQILIKSLQYEN
jgi:hypothetical protein